MKSGPRRNLRFQGPGGTFSAWVEVTTVLAKCLDINQTGEPPPGGVENAFFGVLPYYGRRQRMTFMFFDTIKTARRGKVSRTLWSRSLDSDHLWSLVFGGCTFLDLKRGDEASLSPEPSK